MKRFSIAGSRTGSLLGAIACLVSAVTSAQTPAQARGAPDAVFYNGKVITVDGAFSVQQAFALKGDTFVAVGSDADVRKLARRGTRQVDLRGASVIPGLTDNHDHLFGMERLMRGVDLLGARSTEEIIRRLTPVVAAAKPGDTIFSSTGWQAPITRKDLDQLSPGNPVVLLRQRRGSALMNGAALAKLGISKASPVYSGVKFPTDEAGEPTGETPDWPIGLLATNRLVPAASKAEEEALILRAQQQRHSLGVTSIRDLTNFPSWIEAYVRVWQQGRLTLRVNAGLSIPTLDDPMAQVKEQMLPPGFGDKWLRIDTVGEDPYPPIATREEFIAAAREANRLGWRMSPHIGDEAIETAILAFEAADRDSPLNGKRWVIEHAGGITAPQMDRLNRMGVLVSIQSQVALRFAAMAAAQGRAAAERATPAKEMLDHRLVLISGSDIGGQTPDSSTLNNPFIRLHFFVTRKTLQGEGIGPEQRVSRADALRFATINSAYANFEEGTKGSIEPGKLADFVILSADYLSVPDDDILKIHPLATYVGGKEVYASPER